MDNSQYPARATLPRRNLNLADTDQFRLFVAGVTDYAIYMLSPEGYVSSWNAGAQRFKGYTAEEIIGQHFSLFYTEEDRTSGVPACALRTALEHGKFDAEGWRVRKDGTRFWAHVVIDPIRNERGELLGFAKITRDITERREATLALERAKEALFQSQKLEAMGKLTGGVAHDFNNLLAVIVSGLELLSREVRSPAMQKLFDSMERAATRGATLTQQLLSFARQQPLRREQRNLNQVIAAFEAVLRRACNESITFLLDLAPALSTVRIDATQFEAALLNLVSNARDAMPNGGRLSITTQHVELGEQQIGKLPAGRYVKVTVKDTGNGMPAEVAAHAIEPFFTTKEIGKGTGMGLSQVYGFVQQYEGDLVLETAVGKGTAVSLYLPVVSADDETATKELDGHTGNETALVVDDQPDVLDAVVALFRDMGYEVLSANNGKDAIEIIKRTPNINILFTDVLMPGMNGVALAQEARKLDANIKIILASGFPAPAIAAENADFENFSFINKPYRLADLLKILRKAV